MVLSKKDDFKKSGPVKLNSDFNLNPCGNLDVFQIFSTIFSASKLSNIIFPFVFSFTIFLICSVVSVIKALGG
jgi:hypothetical protein